jgi:hypothetical protein
MSSAVLGEELLSPPSDGITSLRFCGDGDLLLASAWDGVSATLLARRS